MQLIYSIKGERVGTNTMLTVLKKTKRGARVPYTQVLCPTQDGRLVGEATQTAVTEAQAQYVAEMTPVVNGV